MILHRLVVASAAAIATAAVTVACGQGSGSAAPSAVPDSVKIRLDSAPPHLNPLVPTGTNTRTQQSNVVFRSTYDQLVTVDGNGKVVPYLAKTWSVAPTSATFTLRSDVTCVDGSKLTPSTVAASLQAAIKSDAQAMPALFGPGPYTVSANDSAGTVTLTTSASNSDLLYGFADTAVAIVCNAASVTPAQFDSQAQGTGAYTITSWVPGGQTISLKVRPEWKWGPNGQSAASLPKTVTLQVIENETTVANLLLTAGLDIADVVGPDVQRLQASKGITTVRFASFLATPMFMNQQAGRVTQDAQVRKALMTAVDPAGWNQAAYGGTGVLSSSFIVQGAPCYAGATTKLVPKPSPSAAKAILEAEGYTADAGGHLQKAGKPLTVNVIGSVLQNQGAEYLASQFEAAGIAVKLEQLPYLSWSARLGPGNWDVTTFVDQNSRLPAWGTIAQYFTGQIAPAGRNRSMIFDPQVDSQILAALQAPQASRCAAWGMLQETLLKNSDLLPLAAPVRYKFSRVGTIGVTYLGESSPVYISL